MRPSGVERRRRWWLYGPLAALAAAAASAQMPGSTPVRLVDVIEVSERGDQVDVTMVFNCSMRFVTNMPATEGSEVHIQLVPLADCRVNPFSLIPSEIPPLSGGAGIVSAARMDALAPGQITVTLSFVKNERFVLAQGVDPRGLRLRLVDRVHGRVRVAGPQSEMVSNFAINLESQPKPFTPAEVDLAHQRLQAPVFVSETLVDGERWYRLRVGPIERRAEADRLLNQALGDYPRAWLAIGDDAVTSDANAAGMQGAPLPPVERIGSDPALPPEKLAQILAEARTAMTARDYPKAIALLTQLQRQPEFPDRARAQELLGLARERSGQLAHAKAEYQEYLRRYPHGEAAERVAFRLRTLSAAEATARTGRDANANAQGWQLSGGFSQTFRYDDTRVTNGVPPPSSTIPQQPLAPDVTQDNALFTDVDLLARRRGETFDWIGRFSGGYDYVQGGVGDATRVSLASIELLDRPLGLLARLGRQASNADGILGTFDGLYLSWQFRPSWAVNAAVGFPVDLLTVSPQTQQRFEMLALAYTPPNAHWDASIFATTQEFDGLRDRQAVGLEGRYLAGHASLVSVIDYDTFYHSLNTASLIGTLQLPARWSVSFDAEQRNAPVLTTENALIGQPFTDLSQMRQVFTDEEIYQLARDRTASTSIYSLTATRPLGERLQMTAQVAANETGATPASGGVPAEPATGMLLNYQAQLYASSLWASGDFNVVTLTHGTTEIGRVDSVNLTSRFPVGGAWRLAPRFTIERLSDSTDGSSQTSYLPSALLDYQRGNKLLQLEVGGELGNREAFLTLANGQVVQTQKTTRYYVSLSYRINFNK
jgi:hypothetical protein